MRKQQFSVDIHECRFVVLQLKRAEVISFKLFQRDRNYIARVFEFDGVNNRWNKIR
jgi:hypothetical protein